MTAGDPAGSSLALARRCAPGLVAADAGERAITVDQSNRSVVVGERVVVKWLTPPRPFPHPGVTLLRHLTEVGYTEMPAFLGAHVEGDHVVAMLTEFVAGALDGWDWFVDELITALESGDMRSTMATARRIGALAARLHGALATPSSVVTAPVAQATLAAEHRRAQRLLADAMAETAGAAGDRLAARATAIRAAIDALDPTRVVPVQSIHGDLHVGQLLRAGDTIWVNDFDGNPIGSRDEDATLRSPLVDLASLLQSIDHVGRIVQKRRPADRDAIELWIAVAVPAALDAYERELADVAGGSGNIRHEPARADASRAFVPPSAATLSALGGRRAKSDVAGGSGTIRHEPARGDGARAFVPPTAATSSAAGGRRAKSDVAGGSGTIGHAPVDGIASRAFVPPTAATSSALVVADAPLLFALRVVQELHEFLYAARSLPVWLYVPDGALTAMFPGD